MYYEKEQQAQVIKRYILLKRLQSSEWIYANILIFYYLTLW